MLRRLICRGCTRCLGHRPIGVKFRRKKRRLPVGAGGGSGVVGTLASPWEQGCALMTTGRGRRKRPHSASTPLPPLQWDGFACPGMYRGNVTGRAQAPGQGEHKASPLQWDGFAHGRNNSSINIIGRSPILRHLWISHKAGWFLLQREQFHLSR